MNGMVTKVDNIFMGGYQNQCVGFGLTVELDDGFSFVHVEEAFFNNEEAIIDVVQKRDILFEKYGASDLEDFIGTYVEIVQEGENFSIDF